MRSMSSFAVSIGDNEHLPYPLPARNLRSPQHLTAVFFVLTCEYGIIVENYSWQRIDLSLDRLFDDSTISVIIMAYQTSFL